MKIACFPGDGIGPEVMVETRRVLDALSLPGLVIFEGDVGAAAYRRHAHPLPPETLEMARLADAILFGAVGDEACDALEAHLRPEQAILGLRQALGLFANLRPAVLHPSLAHLSPLRPARAAGIDMLIVRELTGDVYFGEKSRRRLDDGRQQGFDLMSYAQDEVARIAHVAFKAAAGRGGRVTSVDKANVLETSRLWREVTIDVARHYPDIELEHVYVDNAAMQMVRDPARFDVLLTGNLFGDILSDLAAACTGSIGLMASAALGEEQGTFGPRGLYEPAHGSAPDIAGRGVANPLAMIASLALALRHSLGREEEAQAIERAIAAVLSDGVLGRDLGGEAGTRAIGDAVLERL